MPEMFGLQQRNDPMRISGIRPVRPKVLLLHLTLVILKCKSRFERSLPNSVDSLRLCLLLFLVTQRSYGEPQKIYLCRFIPSLREVSLQRICFVAARQGHCRDKSSNFDPVLAQL